VSVKHASALALGALAAAAGLAGVVLFETPTSAPAPSLQPPVSADAPVDPSDPDAILVQAEPSPNGRWLAFGLDIERVAGAQSLYVVSLDAGDRFYVCEGVLAPVPWDSEGRLVYVDRSAAAPRAAWLDLEAFEIVRTASARELSGLVDPALEGPRWAERTQSRRADGGYNERIVWRGRDVVLEIETQSLFDVEVSSQSGVVFELRRYGQRRSLLRHDLRTGEATTLCESESLALFRLAPDGEKVLASERANGVVTFVARSARDGRELCAPWVGERVTANWLFRRDSRFVIVSRGEASELIDLDSGASTPLGSVPATSLDVRVLDEQRLLRRTEHAIDVLDRSGAVIRSIFPSKR